MSSFHKTVNKVFDMGILLRQMGCETDGSRAIRCPFHPDTRPSAKFYPESNELYCFAESKTYRPFDALVRLGVSRARITQILLKADLSVAASPKVKKNLFREDSEKKIQENRLLFMKGDISLGSHLKCLQSLMAEVP